MTPTERLVLANQVAIMKWIGKGDHTTNYFSQNIRNTEEALAPQSQDVGYEREIAGKKLSHPPRYCNECHIILLEGEKNLCDKCSLKSEEKSQ